MVTLNFLQNLLVHHSEDTALFADDTEVSYGELVTAVNALAVALQNKDPLPGSRVVICAANSLEYLIAVLAVQAAGKIMVPVAISESPETIFKILVNSQPSAVIVDQAGNERVKCDDDLKITFSQFEGLVRTYFGQKPESVNPAEISTALPPAEVSAPLSEAAE
jgi:acyl-CoA synthetase (AMP-forming)/AMP-acid ligase II